MEEQTSIIILTREQLLYLATAIIVAGIASNYSTVCPSTTHVVVAKGIAQELMDRILEEKAR